MKKFLFLILVSSASIFAKSTLSCSNIKEFKDFQLENLRYAYHYGKKHKLGFTMAAIAWKESCAGAYRYNAQDPSAGNYHVLLDNAVKLDRIFRGVKNPDKPISGFERNKIADRLVRSKRFASKIALHQLLEWKKVRNGDMRKVLKSYNRGYSWETSEANNKSAEAYADDILDKIKVLQKFYEKSPRMRKPVEL